MVLLQGLVQSDSQMVMRRKSVRQSLTRPVGRASPSAGRSPGCSHLMAAAVQEQESPKEPGRKRVVSFLLWSQAAQRAQSLNGTRVKVHCKRNMGSGMYCFEIYSMPQERGGTGHGEQPSEALSPRSAHDKAATVLALPCPSVGNQSV